MKYNIYLAGTPETVDKPFHSSVDEWTVGRLAASLREAFPNWDVNVYEITETKVDL